MSDIPRDKVLDKIRKLIALSGSSNIHEAAVAAAAAQRLMLTYRVSETDITVESSEDDVVMDQEIYRDLHLKSPPRWHGVLLGGVAAVNFCKLIYDMERRGYSWEARRHRIYRIIGSERDRATVKYLYEMFRLEVERLCDSVSRSLGYDRAERASFKLGAASAMAEKLRREYQSFRVEMQTARNTQAIAVIDKSAAAIDQFVNQHFPRLGTLRGASASRAGAYHRGREAGSRVDVSPPDRRLDAARKGLGDGSSGG